ncbi:hypothetical protein ACI2IX_19905 [Leifsonia aquatica]|uniref:hypothetical protein n=1 Tax=Leifsonia aquatica TaxID=144185 RepID=UPI00384ACEA4
MTTMPALSGAPLWPADWSQLVPDLLSSVILGGLIAVLLAIWERRANKRQAGAIALASWAVARSRVVVAVSNPAPTIEGVTRSGSLGHSFADVAAAIEGLPLATWHSAAIANAEISWANALATDLPLLDGAQRRLLAMIDASLLLGNTAFLMYPEEEKEPYRRATLRRLAPEEDDPEMLERALAGALNMRTEKWFDRLALIATDAARDADVKSAYKEWATIYGRVHDTYSRLRAEMHPASATEKA